MKFAVILIFSVFFADAKAQSNSCGPIDGNGTFRCTCTTDEELKVNNNDGTRTISSLIVSNCSSASFSFLKGLGFDTTLKTMKFENIKTELHFCPILYVEELKQVWFSNIGYIKSLTDECTFQAFTKLEHFLIENTAIGLLDQSFEHVEVHTFTMKNVTVDDLKDLNFTSTNGRGLHIINSHIKQVSENSLKFENFKNVTIINTTFDFVGHVGSITINGGSIIISNSNFVNARVMATGTEFIEINDTCASGQNSAMHLQSNRITAYRNKWPTEIVCSPHTARKNRGNNEVCKGAKCNCSVHKKCVDNNRCRGGRGSWRPNHAKTIHHETSRSFFLCFFIIASAMVGKI